MATDTLLNILSAPLLLIFGLILGGTVVMTGIVVLVYILCSKEKRREVSTKNGSYTSVNLVEPVRSSSNQIE